MTGWAPGGCHKNHANFKIKYTPIGHRVERTNRRCSATPWPYLALESTRAGADMAPDTAPRGGVSSAEAVPSAMAALGQKPKIMHTDSGPFSALQVYLVTEGMESAPAADPPSDSRMVSLQPGLPKALLFNLLSTVGPGRGPQECPRKPF